jgi:transcriptional regulator with XRE-family HTH domain
LTATQARHYTATHVGVNHVGKMTATIARLRTTLALQMALDSKRRAARMAELREGADLTQDALALQSGVSERTIQRIENPEDDIEPRYATREKLAKVLKIKPDDLLPEAVPPSTETNGTTPDLNAALNGNGHQPQDLQALHQKLDALAHDLDWLSSAVEAIALALSEDVELPAREARSKTG